MTAPATPYEDLETQAQVEAIMQQGGGTVVIDFWSPTCGPCKAMAQDFSDVAEQFDSGEIRFCKINTGEHPELSAPFNVRSVPTILFVHDGKIHDGVVGKMNAKDLGEKSEWLLQRSQRKPGLFSKLFG